MTTRSWCRSTADSWRSTILDKILPMIKLTIHLWSKLSDPRCLEERQRTFFFFLQRVTSRSISVEPIERWLHRDAWCKHQRRNKVRNFSFSLITFLYFICELGSILSMIMLTLHLRSKLSDPRYLEEHQRKASFFLQRITSRSISVKPIERWLHHDAWCKHWRRNKVRNFNFSYSSLVHLWSS